MKFKPFIAALAALCAVVAVYAAINFPSAPATGNTHTAAGSTWAFDGTTWTTGRAAAVTANVAPGAVTANTTVSFSSANALVRVTTNGIDPSATVGTIAYAPLTITANTTVEAIAYGSGLFAGSVQSFAYTIDPLPIVSTITINTGGTTANIVFSENVTYGAGGSAGWTPTLSGGAATWTYSAGNTTANHTFTINRTVIDTETGTLAYTQPGNGAEDSAAQDLATFSGTSITNNSTQTGGGASASDTFEAMTSGDLLSVSGNWAGVGTNAMTAVTEGGGKVAFANAVGDAAARYTATSFAANHSSEITLYLTGTPLGGIGPAVRMQSGADTYYFVYYDENGTDLYLYRRTAGTNAQVGSTYNVDLADTNKIKLTVTGSGSATRLTVALDTGSGYADVGALTSVDPSGTYIDGGQPGIYGYGANQSISARAWAAADN